MFAQLLARRARTAVGVVSTAVLTSFITVGTAAAPAHADLLPYVPWSSYLSGWTD